MAIVAVFSSIGPLIKATRDEHMVKISDITLVPDKNNVPPSDPPSSNDIQNFDNVEGRAIISAVNKYNQDLPLAQVMLVPNVTRGSTYFLDDVITGWDSDGYKVHRIQWPLPSSALATERFLDANRYHQTVDGATNRPMLQFMDGYIPTTPFVLWYFRPHVFDIGLDTTSIPAEDFEAIANLAAAKVLRKASKKAGGFGDRVGGFESKDLSGVRQRYLDDAKECEGVYQTLVDNKLPSFPAQFISWALEGQLGPLVLHNLWIR